MSGPSTGDYTSAVLIFLVVYAIIIAVGLIISYLLTAITLAMFFRKVGVNPGIAWVPIYNYWRWLEVGGHNGQLAVLMLVPYAGIVTRIFLYIGMYRTGIAFGKDSSWVVLGIFLPFVWCILLGRPNEVYRPEWITARGYPPPRAGFGAVPVTHTSVVPPAAAS
jgi:hypothetical protein